MYKMAVLDIDGTVMTKWKHITGRMKRAAQKLKAKGIPVCLSTGRNVASAMPVAKALRLNTPVMCIDGMIMVDPATKQVLYERKLPNSVMRQVLDVVKKHHVFVEILTARHYYQYMKDKSLKGFDFNVFGVTFAPMLLLVRWLEFRFGIRRVKNLDRFYYMEEQIYEIVAIGEQAETEALKRELEALDNSDILLRELWDCMLFVSARQVSKAEGMKVLCEYFGVTPNEVVAIGDDMNDIDMLREAGMGVAMGNAKDNVKAAADYVTKSNQEHGAALALEKFFLHDSL